MDGHRRLPLTMEEILDDSLFDPPVFYLNGSCDAKLNCFSLASPSTPANDIGCCNRQDCQNGQGRWGSFSSDESGPTMVDDNSGTSDSDAESLTDIRSPGETFSRNPHEKQQNVSREEVSIVYRRPYKSSAPELPCVPSAHSTVRRDHLQPNPMALPTGGRLTPAFTSNVGSKSHDHYHSHTRRNIDRVPDLSKSLPSLPNRSVSQTRYCASKAPRAQPNWNPRPTYRQHPFPADSPCQVRPSANPCNSSHPFSFHNTPPLPPVTQGEKSVFECDSDDEKYFRSATRSSPSLASKLHFRSVSLGNRRLGFPISKEGGKQGHGGRVRRRSATDFVRDMFGIRRN